ncbi:MAG: ATP-binding cassette domain-containing protein [Candidatus Schekmanbacteria bacterium]|nr:ATP-binding cassette domain-containing protein [Candidatus Schekmanbacteria bacterium]
MGPAIAVDSLAKVYVVRRRAPGMRAAIRQLFAPHRELVHALRGISFSLEQGERVAFLGPNGAGKSTTIKLLSGILHPTSGALSVLGMQPWAHRRRLGYDIGTIFGQRSQLWYHLPASDTFRLLARIYDMNERAFRQRLSFLVSTFAIAHLVENPVHALSLGERMRCELVASLLHSPKVLFLDEPTIGLDVTAKAVIRDLIRDQSARDGTTVLLTSHDTGDMERVCDRVIIIDAGELVLDKTVGELRRGYIKKKIVTLVTAAPALDLRLPGVTVVSASPHRVALEVDTAITPIDELVAAAIAAARIRDLTVTDPPMEEVIRAIYRDSAELRQGRAGQP